MLYQTTLDELINSVEIWNQRYGLGLTFQGRHYNRAAWVGSDGAVIYAEQLPPMHGQEITALEVERGRLSDTLLRQHFTAVDARDYPHGELGGIAEVELAEIVASTPDAPTDEEARAAWIALQRELKPDADDVTLALAWDALVKRTERGRAARAWLAERAAKSAEQIAAEWLAEALPPATTTEQDKRETVISAGRGGRPGLSEDELVYRLAMAEKGEEIRSARPGLTWKEIAAELDWKYGTSKSGVKLLEDARHRLRRLKESDPAGLLAKVLELRAKETKETKET